MCNQCYNCKNQIRGRNNRSGLCRKCRIEIKENKRSSFNKVDMKKVEIEIMRIQLRQGILDLPNIKN